MNLSSICESLSNNRSSQKVYNEILLQFISTVQFSPIFISDFSSDPFFPDFIQYVFQPIIDTSDKIDVDFLFTIINFLTNLCSSSPNCLRIISASFNPEAFVPILKIKYRNDQKKFYFVLIRFLAFVFSCNLFKFSSPQPIHDFFNFIMAPISSDQNIISSITNSLNEKEEPKTNDQKKKIDDFYNRLNSKSSSSDHSKESSSCQNNNTKSSSSPKSSKSSTSPKPSVNYTIEKTNPLLDMADWALSALNGLVKNNSMAASLIRTVTSFAQLRSQLALFLSNESNSIVLGAVCCLTQLFPNDVTKDAAMGLAFAALMDCSHENVDPENNASLTQNFCFPLKDSLACWIIEEFINEDYVINMEQIGGLIDSLTRSVDVTGIHIFHVVDILINNKKLYEPTRRALIINNRLFNLINIALNNENDFIPISVCELLNILQIDKCEASNSIKKPFSTAIQVLLQQKRKSGFDNKTENIDTISLMIKSHFSIYESSFIARKEAAANLLCVLLETRGASAFVGGLLKKHYENLFFDFERQIGENHTFLSVAYFNFLSMASSFMGNEWRMKLSELSVSTQFPALLAFVLQHSLNRKAIFYSIISLFDMLNSDNKPGVYLRRPNLSSPLYDSAVSGFIAVNKERNNQENQIIDYYKNEINRVKQEKESCEASFEVERAALLGEIDGFKKKIAEFEETEAASNLTITTLQARISRLSTRSKRSSSSSNKSLSATSSPEVTPPKKHARTNFQINQAKEKIDNNMKENNHNKLSSNNVNYSNINYQTEKELRNTRKQLQDSRKENETIRKEVEKLRQLLELSKKQQEKNKKNIAKGEKSLGAKTSTLARIRLENDTLKETISELNQNLTLSRKSLKEEKQKVKQMKQEIEDLNQEIVSLNESKAISQQKYIDKLNKISSGSYNYEESESELTSKQQISSNEKKESELELKIEELQHRINEYQMLFKVIHKSTDKNQNLPATVSEFITPNT